MGNKRILTLSSNGFLSKLELAAVADNDRDLRAVFFVRRYIHDFRDDVFISTDHPTKHHMFAWWKGRTNQRSRRIKDVRIRAWQHEFVNKKSRRVNANEDVQCVRTGSSRASSRKERGN